MAEISEEQREEFLEHVREGKNRQQAAELVSESHKDDTITATRFKFLCRRDGAFNRQYIEAEIEGRGSLVERLERCATEMAEGGHWPALKFLLTTYGDQFAWARSAKVELNGTLEVQAVAGILSRYLPPDQFDALMEVVEQRMVEDGGGQRELTAA